MKFTLIALATFASAVMAGEKIPMLPACGTMSCMFPAMAQSGCDMHNAACLCKHERFLDALYNCVPEHCGHDDYKVFTVQVNKQCKEQTGFHLAPANSKAAKLYH